MRIDKPVYCFQINRELHKYLGLQVDTAFHHTFLRAIALATSRPLYAGHAQVIECFYQDQALLSELVELSRLGRFVSLSKYPTAQDFAESRRRMYEWDKKNYPMYFDSDFAMLASFPTQAHGDPDTTDILRKTYTTLYRDGPPPFENSLQYRERKILEAGASTLSKDASGEDGPITAAFFKRSKIVRRNHELSAVISKVLPRQFTDIYCRIFEAITPTGFPQFDYFEEPKSFPYLDWNVLSSLVTKLGLSQLFLDLSRKGTRRFIEFVSHPNFHQFVQSKDNLLFLLSGASNRAAYSLRVRQALVHPVASRETDDPFFAAAALYRASELLCRDDPALKARRSTMPDAQSWKGRYLIMTATDSEDHALRQEFQFRGFSQPTVINAERFSYVDYFRSDVGRVHHVRTSTGSTGASGAMVMGKNAVEKLNPDYVISVGVCFGLREGNKIWGIS